MATLDAEHFKKSVELQGVGLTVIEFWGRIPKDILKGITSSQWREVYDCAADSHSAKLVAFKRCIIGTSFSMAVAMHWSKLPTELLEQFTFDDWKEIVQYAPESQAKEYAKDKLIEKAVSFNQLLEIVTLLPCNDEKMATALSKMKKDAELPWEFVWIWLMSEDGSKERKEVEEKVKSLNVSLSEWNSAFKIAPKGSAIQSIIQEKIEMLFV